MTLKSGQSCTAKCSSGSRPVVCNEGILATPSNCCGARSAWDGKDGSKCRACSAGKYLATPEWLLFEAKGSTSTFQNRWAGWQTNGTSLHKTSGEGKRAAYDTQALTSIKLSDARGYYVEYALSDGFAGRTLQSIVRGCLGGDTTQGSGESKWRNGHCTIGRRTAVHGISNTDTVLRVGVGDSASGSSDTYDWAVFAPLGGDYKNGRGDFDGSNTWCFGGEDETNNGYNGIVRIFGADESGTSCLRCPAGTLYRCFSAKQSNSRLNLVPLDIRCGVHPLSSLGRIVISQLACSTSHANTGW